MLFTFVRQWICKQRNSFMSAHLGLALPLIMATEMSFLPLRSAQLIRAAKARQFAQKV